MLQERLLAGQEVGWEETWGGRVQRQRRFPRGPFLDNFRADDSPSDQPTGYVATAGMDLSQRQPPPAFSSLVEARRVRRLSTNGIAQSASLASQFFTFSYWMIYYG